MDYAFRVGGIKRVGNLNRQTEQNIGLYGFAGDTMLQRHPVEKLHDKKWMAILLPDLMDGADIGMIECRRRLGLALEAGQGLRVFGDVIGQKLQGHKSVEGHVLGLVDHAHAAAAQLLDDPVVRDGLADHQTGAALRSPHLTDAAAASQRTGSAQPIALNSEHPVIGYPREGATRHCDSGQDGIPSGLSASRKLSSDALYPAFCVRCERKTSRRSKRNSCP